MSKKTFFHFFDENTSIDFRLPVTCTEEEFEEWFEGDIELIDSFVGTLEEIAVHDTDCSEDDETILIGFTSYEAEDKKTINTIIDKWKEKLVELGWAREEDQFIKVKL